MMAVMSLGSAQTTTPWVQAPNEDAGRVLYIGTYEGVVRTRVQNTQDEGGAPASSTSNVWSPLEYNRPLGTGDALWLQRGARAEFYVGASTWRMMGEGQLDLAELSAGKTQLQLSQGGSLWVRVQRLEPGERIEIDTPNVALVVREPGQYRIDVNARLGTTRVVAPIGVWVAYGGDGQSVDLPAGQTWVFSGRDLQRRQEFAYPSDDFDRWIRERDQPSTAPVTSQYVPANMAGYQQLATTPGQWRQEPGLGMVWFPVISISRWEPYRYGRWSWTASWGWTWVDDAPLGFTPFHYGRWTWIGGRWAWVPGGRVHHPAPYPHSHPRPGYGHGYGYGNGNGYGRPPSYVAPVRPPHGGGHGGHGGYGGQGGGSSRPDRPDGSHGAGQGGRQPVTPGSTEPIPMPRPQVHFSGGSSGVAVPPARPSYPQQPPPGNSGQRRPEVNFGTTMPAAPTAPQSYRPVTPASPAAPAVPPGPSVSSYSMGSMNRGATQGAAAATPAAPHVPPVASFPLPGGRSASTVGSER